MGLFEGLFFSHIKKCLIKMAQPECWKSVIFPKYKIWSIYECVVLGPWVLISQGGNVLWGVPLGPEIHTLCRAKAPSHVAPSSVLKLSRWTTSIRDKRTMAVLSQVSQSVRREWGFYTVTLLHEWNLSQVFGSFHLLPWRPNHQFASILTQQQMQ